MAVMSFFYNSHDTVPYLTLIYYTNCISHPILDNKYTICDLIAHHSWIFEQEPMTLRWNYNILGRCFCAQWIHKGKGRREVKVRLNCKRCAWYNFNVLQGGNGAVTHRYYSWVDSSAETTILDIVISSHKQKACCFYLKYHFGRGITFAL